MSKTHLRKILSLINKNVNEYEIRILVSNKMDIGYITEDEASVIDFALEQRTNKLIERLTRYTR